MLIIYAGIYGACQHQTHSWSFHYVRAVNLATKLDEKNTRVMSLSRDSRTLNSDIGTHFRDFLWQINIVQFAL